MEINQVKPCILVVLVIILQTSIASSSGVVQVQSCCQDRNSTTNASCCANLIRMTTRPMNGSLNGTCCQNSTRENAAGPVKRKKIYVGAFVKMRITDRRRSYYATKLALEYINNRADILPDYELLLEAKDTFSGRAVWALYALYNFLTTGPNKVMLIGPESSEALEPVAYLAKRFNLLQISSGASSPNFQMQRDFPFTFRIAPSSSSFSKAKAALIEHFGWKRVAILHEYDPDYFSPTVEILKKELKRRNISIIAVEGFGWRGGVGFQMEKLKNSDARIIIGEFSDISAQIVFCEAYKKEMYGPKYAWIMFGEFNLAKVFTVDPKINPIDCTENQLRNASDYMITTAKTVLRKDKNVTVSGLTAQDFHNTILATKAEEFKSIAAYKFDAMWAVALTLHNASKKIDLEQFNYKSYRIRKEFQDLMQQTNFEGVTGPVRFDRSKERVGTVRLWQLREGVVYDVGQHFTYNDQLEFFEGQKEQLWRDKQPFDHTVRRDRLLINSLPLIFVMWLLAALGLVCSLFFLYFNIVHRKNRAIKMSSPKLNNVIILGCMLCYIAVVLFGLDARFLSFETYGMICNLKSAVLTVSFSVAFGAMFSKTWRVHKIFTAAKTLKKMAIKDIHLLGVVAGLLFVDTIFLTVWFGLDPLKSEPIKFDEETSESMDIIIVPVLYQCTCRYKTYFLAVTYVYKGILLLFGLFLAWETRNVTIPALNDSKYIGMSVYNVVILSAIGAIVVTALDGTRSFEASYAISSLCLIICTTVTLLLVFVPKVQQFLVKREDHHNNSIRTGCSSTLHSGRTTSHTFRFNPQESPASHCRANHVSKQTQTDIDLPGSAVNDACWSRRSNGSANGVVPNRKDDMNLQKNCNLSMGDHLYEVKMDDIRLDDFPNVPVSRYGTDLSGNRIVNLIETDM